MRIGRITNFSIDVPANRIFAGDDRGLVYEFDTTLNCLSRSHDTTHTSAIHCITHDDHYCFSRDVAGNVVRWDRADLTPIDFLVSQHYTLGEVEDGATPVPSQSNAIACVGDKLAVANAYGSVSLFDRKSMRLVDALRMTEGAFPEHINPAGPAGHVIVTDTLGRVYRVSIEDKVVQKTAELFGNTIHCIVPDKRFGRYIGVSDRNCGLFFLDEQLKFSGELRLSNDDVEQIAISRDCSRLYVGCFDHHVHVLQNQKHPIHVGSIGPFKFQVNHVGLLGDDRLVTLLESGELYVVDTASGRIIARVGGTNAIWHHQLIGDRIVCASETGNIETFDIRSKEASINITRVELAAPELGFGRIRKIAACGDGDVVGCATDGSVFRVSPHNEVVWRLLMNGIARDVSVDESKDWGVACSEIGELVLFRLSTGEPVTRFKNDKPLFSAFLHDNVVLAGERTMSPAQGEREPSKLSVHALPSLAPIGAVTHTGNHKRMRLTPSGELLLNGNGSVQIRRYSLPDLQLVKLYKDWAINTPEDAVMVGDHVYVVTYAYQLITYDAESSEAVDVQFVTEGYPKSIQYYKNDDGAEFLIIGGRNFLMAFLIGEDRLPSMVMTRYLFDTYAIPFKGFGAEDAVKLQQPLQAFRLTTERVA